MAYLTIRHFSFRSPITWHKTAQIDKTTVHGPRHLKFENIRALEVNIVIFPLVVRGRQEDGCVYTYAHT